MIVLRKPAAKLRLAGRRNAMNRRHSPAKAGCYYAQKPPNIK
jgi:hypothetical protein